MDDVLDTGKLVDEYFHASQQVIFHLHANCEVSDPLNAWKMGTFLTKA